MSLSVSTNWDTIGTVGLTQIIALILSVSGRLVEFGCLSYNEKKLFDKVPNSTLAEISSTKPEWCDDPEARSAGLRVKAPETSRPPYMIHAWFYTNSNSIKVKVRTRKKDDQVNRIQELIIRAHPLLNTSSSSSGAPGINTSETVGRFYPFPLDLQLTCCHLFDRNVARIYRTDSSKQNTSVTVLWLPNGFVEDFEGPLVFVATISNTMSQYWTQVKSHIQVARRSVKLDEVDTSSGESDEVTPTSSDQ